jgi:enediyne biosynthesis protein E4
VYVLAIGSFKGFRNDLGKAMAQPLVMFKWEESRFIHIPIGLKGSEYWGQLRYAEKIRVKDKDYILIARNNNTPVLLEIKKD